MPKVKNLGNGPVSVYCGGVSMAVPPGESIDSDNYTESELKFYRAHPEAFEVSGDAVAAAGIDADEFQSAQAAKSTLAEIVALFGTEEVDELNVKAAVERLIQDAATKPAETTNDAAFQSPLNSGASDLASAIALLDDANDDHWTQAGLPDISTLKTLTGGDVTRAMVDQLPADQKRERAKDQ